jgi:hypothetical protein
MNTMPIRRTLPAKFFWLPVELTCVHHHWRHCDHAGVAPRTSLTYLEDVAGSRSGGMSNGDFGLCVRTARLKSP